MAQNYDLQNTGPAVQERLDQVMPNKDNLAQEVQARQNGDANLQEQINTINAEIGEHGGGSETINGRLNELEAAVGDGGSVDERIDAAKEEILGGASEDYNTLGKVEGELEDTYRKEETYTKQQVNDLITTPDVQYVSVVATDQTTAVTDLLPATGADDTIYRIGNWDGTQYDTTMYALYAWNGSAYVCLAVRSFVGEVYDISANHPDGQGNPTPYADLRAALDYVPVDIRAGGMSVKFIQGTAQSSDNKYVQFRYMGTATEGSPSPFLDTANWQGVDDTPTAVSKNLVTSGGVKSELDKLGGYTLTGTASSYAYFYEFTPELPIGSIVANKGGKNISLYDASKSASIAIPPGFEVTTAAAYKYIRNSSGSNQYNIEIKGTIGVELSNTQKAIEKEVEIIRASIELNKYINSSVGDIVYNNGTAVSKPIELRNGNGFNIKCEIAPTSYYFYSANPCNSNTFISSNNSGLISSNAKYVVLYWNATAVSTEGFTAQDIQLTDINLINSQLAGSYHKFREDAITVMSDATLELYYTQTCAVKELYIKDASLKNDNLRLSIENTSSNKRIIVNGDSTSLVVYSVPEESSNGIYTLENDLLYIVVDMSMMSGLSTNMTDANALRLTLASFTKIESEEPEPPQPTPTEDKITVDELEVVDWSDKYTDTNKAIWRATSASHTGGVEFSDSARDATPYLDLDGIMEVYMKLPEVSTGAGAAWYNSEKVCLETIDSSNEIKNEKSELWLTVPYGAKYLRTCVNKSDTPYVLKVKQKKQIPISTAAKESYLLNPMIMPLTSRVFATYGDFVNSNNEPITTSRVSLNVVSGGSGEQIKLSFNNRLLRHTATAAVKVSDASSVITWGNSDEPLSNADNYIITVEARFYNEGGDGKLSIVKKNSDGTDAVIATTKTLAFTVAEGNTYHIGYRKVEFDTPDENDKAYGYGEFFVKFGSVEETQRFLYKTNVVYPEGAQEGDPTVRSDSLAGLCGKPYFGIKSGDVVYTNFYISTDYDPQVKGMIIGDSFIGANTLCKDGNIHKKYATLLQNDIGKDDFMVIGKGGEAVDSVVNQFAPYDIAAFKPTYLIIALGVNNHSFDEYLGALSQLLDMLKSRHVEPILTTITPIRPSTTTTNEDVLQAINSWVRESGYRYVDIFNAVAETVSNESVWKTGMNLPDGIHPSLDGHEAIYEAFVRELPEIFEV